MPRAVDEATWRQTVAFAQGQELLTQRTARLTETTSDTATLKNEQDAVAQAKYSYVADPTGVAPSGLANSAKLYLDNLALYEHNHTIALAQLAALEAADPDLDPTDQTTTIEAEYSGLKAANQASYTSADASATSAMITAEASATRSADILTANYLRTHEQSDIDAAYAFAQSDATEYAARVTAIAGHDKSYELGLTLTLQNAARARFI